MRSRNDWPGSCVISTTMWSDSTRVPPVTALRSPPDSRMTGADSPVMADSSTEAMPSITVPSPGMTSPASTTTTSPRRSSFAGFVAAVAQLRDGLRAHRAQRVGLCLAAALGDRLGEVAEEHGEPQPDRDREREPRRVPAAARRVPAEGLTIQISVVSTAPTSTTNMTGLRAMSRGSSLRSDAPIAARGCRARTASARADRSSLRLQRVVELHHVHGLRAAEAEQRPARGVVDQLEHPRERQAALARRRGWPGSARWRTRSAGPRRRPRWSPRRAAPRAAVSPGVNGRSRLR